MKKYLMIAGLVASAQLVSVGFGGTANLENAPSPEIERSSVQEKSFLQALETSVTRNVVKVESQDFDTRVVKDSNLPEGVEVVVQQGKTGEKTFFKSSENMLTADGATQVPVFFEEITLLPTEQVVRIGTNKSVIYGVSSKTKKLEKEKAQKIEREKKAAEKRKKEAKEAAARKKAGKNKVSSAVVGGRITTPSENKAFAKSIFSASDYKCIDILMGRESGWNTTADNPYSSAYGVPQALPGSKMASAGADWRTNGKTQIKWMKTYVDTRYNGACGAKAHSSRVGWY